MRAVADNPEQLVAIFTFAAGGLLVLMGLYCLGGDQWIEKLRARARRIYRRLVSWFIR